MIEEPTKAYGEGRTRAGVSYAQVERAATATLKSERRPTVETVRTALGTGSADTIATALKRFWRDLGARIDGDPAALTRMPPDIAYLAEGMWQRALKLAAEAAKLDDNAARERLRQLQAETEIRQYSYALREKEIDTQARERALADARDHLLSLSKALSREQATNQAQERRIADLETEVTQYGQQIAGPISGAIAQRRPQPNRHAAESARPAAAGTSTRRPARPTEKSTSTKATTNKRPRRLSRNPVRESPSRKHR